MKRGIQGKLVVQGASPEPFKSFVPHPLPPEPPIEFSPGLLDLMDVYAIVRLDSQMSLENWATVVKVLPSRVLAEQEASRLREANRGKHCIYSVQITRFVEAL